MSARAASLRAAVAAVVAVAALLLAAAPDAGASPDAGAARDAGAAPHADAGKPIPNKAGAPAPDAGKAIPNKAGAPAPDAGKPIPGRAGPDAGAGAASARAAHPPAPAATPASATTPPGAAHPGPPHPGTETAPVTAAPGAASPGRSGSAAAASQAPRWQSWRVEGHLIDPRGVVRGFLAPIMDGHKDWSASAQRDVITFCRKIGYAAAIHNRTLPDGDVQTVLVLAPVTRVRRVDIDFSNLVEQIEQPVFEDEIERRMRLRPGTALASEPAARAQQLRAEEERIGDYLRNNGFFEAQVHVTTEPAGPYAVELHVVIHKGPAYYIGKIRVEGNASIERGTIVAMFHHSRVCLFNLCVGEKRFSRQQLNKDVDALVRHYQKRGFPGVRIRTDFDMQTSFKRNTQTVEFTLFIHERRKIDVVFRGNSEKFPYGKLEKVLTFSKDGSYDDVEVAASADAIRRYYQTKGYFEADVTWKRERFDFFDRIVFSIDQGPRLKVKEVAFEGNHAFSAGRLHKLVKTQTYDELALVPSGGYATSLQLSQDVGRIRDLYQGAGYADVQVHAEVARQRRLLGDAAALAAAVAAHTPADGLYVHFLIDEGPRYRVAKVDFTFEGPHVYHRGGLRKVVSLHAGDPYVPDQIASDASKLKRYYFDHGFPVAQVTASHAAASKSDRVVVTYHVTEQQRVHIGKIALRGNFKTHAWVIRHQLRMREGQLLTANRAQAAEGNLRASGLFSAVHLQYFGIDEGDDTANVLVHVEERHDDLAAVALSGGWSTDSSFFSEASWNMDNLGGVGARFDTTFQYGIKILAGESKLVLPRWLVQHYVGSPFLLELAGFYRQEKTVRFGNLTSFGGSVAASRTGHGIFKGWQLSLRYDFHQQNRNVEAVRPSGDSGDVQKVFVPTRTSAIGPQLIIDKRHDKHGRPNPLNPSGGYRLELSALYAENFLIGSDEFIKIHVSGQHYWQITDRLKLVNGIRYDQGIPLGGESLLPAVERFFAGGDTTVRGFEQDRMATEIIREPVPPVDGLEQFRVLPASGNIRFIHNIDLALDVWKLKGFPVATAIFFDTGLVTNSLEGLTLSDFRHSIGIALARWVTPFGQLSLEWAIPLNPQLGDNPLGRFHINVGGTLQF